MTESNSYESLKVYLHEQGHSDREIEVILEKLVEYDRNMMHDSIFDSIDQGTFSLEGFIRETLSEHEQNTGQETPNS